MIAMRWLAAVAVLAGCGDPALCTTDFRVAIDTAVLVTTDFDPVATGVQTPVEVDTSMPAGETVLLQILDSTDAIVGSATATVDAAGVASFGMVTVPSPSATLRATASDVCGSDTATAKLDVRAGATCDLAFVTMPETISFYAPLGVLARAEDVAPTIAGEQAIVSVSTRAGWNVELRERSQVIGDEVIATGTQATAVAMTTATFRDGTTSLFATCSLPPVTLTSAAVFVAVDSVAPTCTIDPPVASGGVLTVTGRSKDGDLEGEPATIAVTPVGGAAIDAGATPIVAGQSHGSVPLPAGPIDVAFSTRDHAHNPCMVTRRF